MSLFLFICVLGPGISDYMIWCFQVITGNLALTKPVVSKEMILGKSVSLLFTSRGLICSSLSLQMTGSLASTSIQAHVL